MKPKIFSAASAHVRSQKRGMASTPDSDAMAAAHWSSCSFWLEIMTSPHPLSARVWQKQSPMPLLAPVTTAMRPRRSFAATIASPYFFNLADNGWSEIRAVLVACHLARIHAGYAVVDVVASAAVVPFAGLAHPVHEIGFVEQGATHLDEVESLFVEHGVGALAVDDSADIDQRQVEFLSEQPGVVEEIERTERLGGDHEAACQSHSIFEPELLHVVRHRVNGHLSAHHIHRGFADEASGENYGMHAGALDHAGHSQAVVNLESPLEAVAHVGLDDYAHV